MRCINSRVLAPVAAVSVLQVCRRSWRRKPSTPTVLVASLHIVDQIRPAESRALGTNEDQRVVVGTDVAIEVGFQLGHEYGRYCEHAPARLALRRTDRQRAVVVLYERLHDGKRPFVKVDATPSQRRQLTEPQAGERGREHKRMKPRIDGISERPNLSERRNGPLGAVLDSGTYDRARIPPR